MAAVEMRVATLDDYAAVLALDPNNTIYSGNDYIPAVYKSWINDPNRVATVGVLDGKIVAFRLAYYIDDGQTLLGMAARVDVNHRGTGAWRQIMHAFSPHELRADVTRFAGISLVEQWHKTKFKTSPTTHMSRAARLLMTRMGQVRQFNPAAISGKNQVGALARSTDGAVCRSLSKAESLQALTNRENQWRLFPNKRIVCSIGLVSYRLLQSNFRRIIEENEVVATINSTGSECHSLSFGCGLEVHNGFQYSVHYYGSHPADDVSDLVNHVMVHLQIAAKQQTKEPLQLRILFSPLMPRDDVTRALDQVPGHEKCALEWLPLAVYERDLVRASAASAKL